MSPETAPPATEPLCNDTNEPITDSTPESYAPREPMQPARVVGSPAEAQMRRAVAAMHDEMPDKGATAEARMRAVAHMTALGYRNKDIAAFTKLAETYISVLKNKPECKALTRVITNQLFINNPKAQFQAMAPRAARTLYRVMNNVDEKGSTRVQAAGEILDRAYGKATQTVEHTGSLIRELFEKMDKKASPEGENDENSAQNDVNIPIDAEFTDLPPPEPPKKETVANSPEASQSIEQWVAKNL